MRSAWMLILVALCMFLSAAFAACDDSDDATRSGSVEIASSGDSAVGSAASGQVDPALALVQTRCTRCHGLERICGKLGVKTREEWQATVDRMRGKGADLSSDEAAQVVEALTQLDAGNPAICQ